MPPRPDRGSGAFPARPDLAAWRRLPPAAIAVWVSGIVGGLAIPLVVLLVLGGERGPLVFSAVFGSIAVIGSVVRWTRFAYRLDGRTSSSVVGCSSGGSGRCHRLGSRAWTWCRSSRTERSAWSS